MTVLDHRHVTQRCSVVHLLLFRMTFPEILDLNRFSEVVENGEETVEAGAEKAAADDSKACAAATTTADSGDEGETVAGKAQSHVRGQDIGWPVGAVLGAVSLCKRGE